MSQEARQIRELLSANQLVEAIDRLGAIDKQMGIRLHREWQKIDYK